MSGFNAQEARTRRVHAPNAISKRKCPPTQTGRQKVWVAQWWDAGTKRSKVLGRCSEVSKGEAEALMSQILRDHNDDAGHHQQPIFTFQQYVNDVFLPVYRKKWKESTRSTSEPDILRYLIPEFGKQRLEVINRNHMQRFLEQSAQVLSSSVVGHLRWHLNEISNSLPAMALSHSIRLQHCTFRRAKFLRRSGL